VLLSGQPRDRLHALLHGLDGVLLTYKLPPHIFD
jgi:hypothetical protein